MALDNVKRFKQNFIDGKDVEDDVDLAFDSKLYHFHRIDIACKCKFSFVCHGFIDFVLLLFCPLFVYMRLVVPGVMTSPSFLVSMFVSHGSTYRRQLPQSK